MIDRHLGLNYFSLMTLKTAFLGAAILLAASYTAPSVAMAGTGGFSLSGHVNYGFAINDESASIPTLSYESPDNFGFGVGGRLGYTLPFGLYIGGLVDYYFGSEGGLSRPVNGSNNDPVTLDISTTSLHIAAEAGLDLAVSPWFVIRPLVGIGYYHIEGDFSLSGFADSVTSDGGSFVVSPGLTAQLHISKLLFLTAGAHAVIPTEHLETNQKSLTLSAGLGLQF